MRLVATAISMTLFLCKIAVCKGMNSIPVKLESTVGHCQGPAILSDSPHRRATYAFRFPDVCGPVDG